MGPKDNSGARFEQTIGAMYGVDEAERAEDDNDDNDEVDGEETSTEEP